MPNVIIFGLQWGDEGKGKIVDALASRADLVVRYQGGHNAGHTLVIDGETFKLSLLPSGIVRAQTRCVIGNGVVIDPWAMREEILALRQRGIKITSGNLAISDAACLILPIHVELDSLREKAAGANRIGTTGRGIGPAYEDKVGRRAIRIADLADPISLKAAIKRLLAHHDPLRKGLGASLVDGTELQEKLTEVAGDISDFVRSPQWIARRWIRPSENVLFEGAQGALLDLDHGTYPFVTSSTTVPGGAGSGCGVGPQHLGLALGVCKAYATRVGSGPFPTEIRGPLQNTLQRAGRETGTVTGRERRCGWFDAVSARHACDAAGAERLAITKIDVLDGLDEIQICVAYDINGRKVDELPTRLEDQRQITPVYETVAGWPTACAGIRSPSELPDEALNYIRRIEDLLGRTAAIISTSPNRDDTISLADPFAPR